MIRLLFILILHSLFVTVARSQAFTVDDLLTLSTNPPKNIDNYMNRKGFLPGGRSLQDNATAFSFFQKKSNKKKDSLFIRRSFDMYKKGDTYCFALHTSSEEEYLNGMNRLKKAGFYYDKNKDTSATPSLMFQKRNTRVLASFARVDTTVQYTFLLQKKELPDPATIQFAEDLLKFDSHEYLVSFFGENNVKKDVYYFTEKEMKKCSILFPNTSRQAIFVWDDEGDLCKLSYVLISGISPTLSAIRYSGNVNQNRWTSEGGIYSSMSLRELLQLNGNDFEFYGSNSEFAYMIAPKRTGHIDFKKTGVMLGCLDCSDSKLLEKSKISAVDAVDKNLSLYIFYIMIRP